MVIVLNAHAPTEAKGEDSKDSFYEELEGFFYHFPKYHTKILLGDFNANVGRERVLSNRLLGTRVYIRMVMIMVLT
jgi:hypothetical protein